MKHLYFLFFLLAFLVTSCDEEFPMDYCPCHESGNIIGGWDDGRDTTIVNKKDTLGGFDVSVDGWTNSETHDILL